MELFIELYRWWWLMPHPIPRDENKDWVCSVFVWPLCLCSVTAFYHGRRPSLSSTVERWHRRNISIKLCPNYYTSAKHSLEVFPYRMSLSALSLDGVGVGLLAGARREMTGILVERRRRLCVTTTYSVREFMKYFNLNALNVIRKPCPRLPPRVASSSFCVIGWAWEISREIIILFHCRFFSFFFFYYYRYFCFGSLCVLASRPHGQRDCVRWVSEI